MPVGAGRGEEQGGRAAQLAPRISAAHGRMRAPPIGAAAHVEHAPAQHEALAGQLDLDPGGLAGLHLDRAALAGPAPLAGGGGGVLARDQLLDPEPAAAGRGGGPPGLPVAGRRACPRPRARARPRVTVAPSTGAPSASRTIPSMAPEGSAGALLLSPAGSRPLDQPARPAAPAGARPPAGVRPLVASCQIPTPPSPATTAINTKKTSPRERPFDMAPSSLGEPSARETSQC